MDQRLYLLLRGLALLVRLENDAEDIRQLLTAARQRLILCLQAVLIDVRCQLLQQILHRQGEGDDVASCTIAVPCHVRLLVEDCGLSPELAFHAEKYHARKAR